MEDARAGEPVMLTLAETMVEAFCEALGFEGSERRPRVDVWGLAARAGAEAKLEGSLREDGRVEDTPLSTRILLCSSPLETRRRFTLGHELGHLVLSDPRVFRLVQLEFAGEHFQVEQLCDAFSAELLMPRKWLVWRYEGASEEFDALTDLTREAGVSWAAGFIRLAAVLGWRHSLIFVRRRDWSPTVMGGPYQFEKVELSPETPAALRDLRGQRTSKRARRESHFVEVDFRVRDEPRRLTCEALPTASGIWLLTRLPRRTRDEEEPSVASDQRTYWSALDRER